MNSFVPRLCAHAFFRELILIYPFYAVMFVESGLTGTDVSILFAVWSASVVLLEIPTGALADRLPRQPLLFAAQILRALGFSCWIWFPTFWGYLVGFVLWGACSAVSSGAFEALVYDELAFASRTDEFGRVLGRARATANLGLVSGSIAVIWLVESGYTTLLWASVLGCVVAGLLALTLPSAPSARPAELRHYSQILLEARSLVSRGGPLLALIVFSAVSTSLPQTLDEYWTVFGAEVGLPKRLLGPLLAAVYVVQAVGSWTAHRFSGASHHTLYMLFAASGVLIALAGWIADLVSLLLLLWFVIVTTVVEVLLEVRLQDALPTGVRATVSSVRNLANELTGIVVFLIMGVIVTGITFAPGLLVFGLFISAFGLAFRIARVRFPISDAS